MEILKLMHVFMGTPMSRAMILVSMVAAFAIKAFKKLVSYRMYINCRTALGVVRAARGSGISLILFCI